MRVRFHPSASDELAEAVAWYESREPGLGVEFSEEVGRAVVAIGESPTTLARSQGLAIRSPLPPLALSLRRAPSAAVA